jgi:hypothetical protein
MIDSQTSDLRSAVGPVKRHEAEVVNPFGHFRISAKAQQKKAA